MTESETLMVLHKTLVESELHTFPIIGKIKTSNNQGVYIIYDSNMQVLHVGKTNSAREGINQRLLNHVRNQSSFSKLYMKPNKINLRGFGQFKFIEINEGRTRSLLEALTAGLLCPLHIGTGEKIKLML